MRWYRSLYWRIAIGFVLCLGAVLVVQAMLFVWVGARAGPTMPGRPPERFGRSIAVDLSRALEQQPALDLAAYLREQYGRDAHPFFVVLADGTVVTNGSAPVPEALVRAARQRLQAGIDAPGRPPRGRPPRDRARDPAFPPRGDGDRPPPASAARPRTLGEAARFRTPLPAPIVVDGRLAGVVMVLPQAPFAYLLGRYAPTLALVTLASLIVGGVLATVAIFGPARGRLLQVEEAARRLGGGDLTARAPAGGGDEVAAVAAAFNAMADELAARAEALAASDRVRRQLLADVSHELTTPVTAVRGYLETLTMPGFAVDADTRARYLGIIGEETARLERIIGDLLELARLEGGGGSLVPALVEVRQLFDRVRARHERTCADADIELVSRIEPGAERVRGDRDRLEQALQNLAANAIRYAPPGSAVELSARRQDGGLSFSVSDQGPGIAPEHLAHVFDRFYKADPSRTAAGQAAGGGSGLGLSIVKAIAERHGGTATVARVDGRTVFTFTIADAERTAAGP
jgi:two-component system OmpR family sensor kinase